MSDEGGYLLSEEEAKAFQWLLDNKIVMVQWEQWYNLKTGVVTKGGVHYYLADGTEFTAINSL